MNWIASHLFPPPYPMGNIAGYEITATDVALTIYIFIIGVGLSFWLDNWLWLLATVLSYIMAEMI
jgi:hypothetical protein